MSHIKWLGIIKDDLGQYRGDAHYSFMGTAYIIILRMHKI